MIREARSHDLDDINTLLHRAHERFAYPGRVDEGKTRYALARALAHGSVLVLVSEPVHAVLIGELVQPWYSREWIGTDWLIYAEDGSGAALVRHFTRWAREHGAVAVELSVSSGFQANRVAQFFTALGVPQIGTLHRKVFEE